MYGILQCHETFSKNCYSCSFDRYRTTLRFTEPLLQLAIIQIARDKVFPFHIGLWCWGLWGYGAEFF